VVLELTGEEIVTMMLTYCHNTLFSFPYVGGMQCEITLDETNPQKVKSVRLLTPEGKKMNMKKKYRVATNNYITATSTIPEGSDHVINVLTTDLIMQYLEKKGTVSYQGSTHLKILSK
jgi:2',3'-cyclic-nucleotide 2'-phosphodiesterase (5'-nucleotidase family)